MRCAAPDQQRLCLALGVEPRYGHLMPERPSVPLIGILVGAVLFNLAPIAGLVATIALILRAFNGVDTVDPSFKAKFLAQGISDAMNCTAAGIAVALIGLVIALVSLALQARCERRATGKANWDGGRLPTEEE